jgi:hypothetical protein
VTVFWGTHFAVPAQLAALSSSWSAATSWLTLTWTPYAGDPLLFWRYRVYRSIDAGLTWVQIDEDALADPTVGSFVDYDAPLGIPLQYRVTMDNGAYEGPVATRSDQLSLTGWYIVVPGDAAHSFRIHHVVPSPTRNPRSAKVARYPMGRSSALVTSSPLRLPSGAFTAEIRLFYHAEVALLRAVEDLAADLAYVIIKNTDNESLRVQISGWSEDVASQMLTRMTTTWWCVQDPEA